jgi:uncharacterized protein
MNSVGMFALFYSTVTPNQSTETKLEKQTPVASASSPNLYSYMSSSREVFQRYVLGVHAKTKRSLAEEAESGDEGSVNSWLREGADPNEQDSYGYTPLINASALGRLNAVKQLVQSGADINRTGPFGFSAMQAAAQNGHREVVSYLLRNGADINLQNSDLDTSMHLAIRAQRIEIVYMLLRNGANPRIEGFNRKNCIQCAQDCGLNDLAETLRNYNLSTGYHSSFSSPSLQTSIPV